MAGLVVPIGHLLGPLYLEKGPEFPSSFDIRMGDDVMSLSPPSYEVWAAAHGDPKTIAQQPPSKESVLAAVAELGVPDAARRYAEMLTSGVLVEVRRSEIARRAFAEKHRAIPLALGLGNSADKPEQLLIGMAGEPRVSVSAGVYSLWMFAHRAPTLWRACKNVVAMWAESGQAKLDPTSLLAEFMDQLPSLLVASCICIDQRRGHG